VKGTRSDSHTGIAVDLYFVGAKKGPAITYAWFGTLSADFQANDFDLNGDVSGAVFLTQGQVLLGFQSKVHPTGLRVIKAEETDVAEIEADRRLVAWILASVGKNEDWLAKELDIANNIDEKTGEWMKIPVKNGTRRLPSLKSYSAITNNCFNYTADALGVYVGYEWSGQSDPCAGGDTLVKRWDAAVKRGAKKGMPAKAVHSIYDNVLPYP
jgi:hypothetical protein